MGIGGFEWVIIVLVVLLLFGAKRIPELARGLGQGIREFRKASDEIKKEIDKGQREVLDSTKYDSDSVKKKQRDSEPVKSSTGDSSPSGSESGETGENENKG